MGAHLQHNDTLFGDLPRIKSSNRLDHREELEAAEDIIFNERHVPAPSKQYIERAIQLLEDYKRRIWG